MSEVFCALALSLGGVLLRNLLCGEHLRRSLCIHLDLIVANRSLIFTTPHLITPQPTSCDANSTLKSSMNISSRLAPVDKGIAKRSNLGFCEPLQTLICGQPEKPTEARSACLDTNDPACYVRVGILEREAKNLPKACQAHQSQRYGYEGLKCATLP